MEVKQGGGVFANDRICAELTEGAQCRMVYSGHEGLGYIPNTWLCGALTLHVQSSEII